MQCQQLSVQLDDKRGYIKDGKTGNFADNVSARQFGPDAPNQSWVSDITVVHTVQGFLWVVTVLDLFSRRIVGWAMGHYGSSLGDQCLSLNNGNLAKTT